LNIADSLRKRGTDTLTKVLEAVLKDRGEHDPIPAGFNVGELVFTGVIDYGAYRDLQRHRRGYQQRIQPTQHFSWALPEFITDRADLLEVCDDALTAIGEVFYDTQFADDSGCEYFTLLCHNVQFTYVCDVAQLCYVAELRTAQAGHISYRTFVQDMARCALQAFPELEPYLRVDWSNDTDRRAQEESSVRKEKALRA
jgi:hypothetical protein